MMAVLKSVRTFGTAAGAVVLALLAGHPLAAQVPTAGADPAAAILASHKVIDDSYAEAPMSPFTAIAVQYFEAGQTVRLGTGSDGAAFSPASPVPDTLDLTLEDGAFWVTPVAGSTPVLLGTTGHGDITGLPGTPIRSRVKLATRDVVGVGRYFVEFFARPDSGNVRVFDPDAHARKSFAGLKWYSPNLALIVQASFVPSGSPARLTIMTSRGLQREYFRVGVFEFVIGGTTHRLAALAPSTTPGAGDELFVPFRDSTTGVETYEVGRYLTVPFAQAAGSYVLDFNGATNPLCNYSPHYNCPIPPRENVLTVAIRAGEMTYPRPH